MPKPVVTHEPDSTIGRADASNDGNLTDNGLLRILSIGLLIGTPLIYLFTLVLVTLSGIGVGNALAVATIPALFGGITFGGFVPLMIHMSRQEHRTETARAADRAASANSHRDFEPAPTLAA